MKRRGAAARGGGGGRRAHLEPPVLQHLLDRHHLLRLLVERLEHHAERAVADHLLRHVHLALAVDAAAAAAAAAAGGGGGSLRSLPRAPPDLRSFERDDPSESRSCPSSCCSDSVSAAPRAAPPAPDPPPAPPPPPERPEEERAGRAAAGGGCIEPLPPAHAPRAPAPRPPPHTAPWDSASVCDPAIDTSTAPRGRRRFPSSVTTPTSSARTGFTSPLHGRPRNTTASTETLSRRDPSLPPSSCAGAAAAQPEPPRGKLRYFYPGMQISMS